MLIYVLRHGITQWNKLKKVQGAMDIPLAPEGIELAKRTGEALKDVPFDICFTSPLARARQTAHYVLGNRQIPVIEDKRIQEIDFGVLEGSRFKDEQGKIISHEMEIFFEEPQKFERPQNGENISDILKRTREFWVEKTMVNASEALLRVHQLIPPQDRPEFTQDREGFFYLERIEGNCEDIWSMRRSTSVTRGDQSPR